MTKKDFGNSRFRGLIVQEFTYLISEIDWSYRTKFGPMSRYFLPENSWPVLKIKRKLKKTLLMR